jgi:caffeoyl-CoA O-methyltransferase
VDIVRPEIERYVEEHTTPPTALLEELTAETQATMGSPEMLTGAVQGRLLELLVYAAAARRVLEIGTYTGYCAAIPSRPHEPHILLSQDRKETLGSISADHS